MGMYIIIAVTIYLISYHYIVLVLTTNNHKPHHKFHKLKHQHLMNIKLVRIV